MYGPNTGDPVPSLQVYHVLCGVRDQSLVYALFVYVSVAEKNPGRLVSSEATYASKAHGLGKSGHIRYESNFSYFIDST